MLTYGYAGVSGFDQDFAVQEARRGLPGSSFRKNDALRNGRTTFVIL